MTNATNEDFFQITEHWRISNAAPLFPNKLYLLQSWSQWKNRSISFAFPSHFLSNIPIPVSIPINSVCASHSHGISKGPMGIPVSCTPRLQTILEELSQEHINKVVANFIKHLTAYMAVAVNGGHFKHLQYLCLSPSIYPPLIAHKTTVFRATNKLPVKTTPEHWEIWVVSIDAVKFVLFSLIQLSIKVYILLCNSCVKFNIRNPHTSDLRLL